jgi:hypothetical protein
LLKSRKKSSGVLLAVLLNPLPPPGYRSHSSFMQELRVVKNHDAAVKFVRRILDKLRPLVSTAACCPFSENDGIPIFFFCILTSTIAPAFASRIMTLN